MDCLGCDNKHDEKFCPECGEKAGIKKITFSSLAENTLAGFINMDRGFLFNLKSLILVPRKITFDYILGKRKGVLNPVTFLILSVSSYLLVTNTIVFDFEPTTSDSVSQSLPYRIGKSGGEFIKKYFKYFWILSTFFLALSTKIIYKKFNYLEHVAINSFIIGLATIVAIFGYLIFEFDILFDPFVYLTILGLIFRIFKDDKDLFGSFLVAFSVVFLFIIQLFGAVFLIGYLRL